jgi:hypothetical protein
VFAVQLVVHSKCGLCWHHATCTFDCSSIVVSGEGVSVHFCSKTSSGSLRSLLEQCVAAGAAPPALQREVDILNLGRIAEEYIESPHRAVKCEHSRAPASRIPWISSTLNLPAHLARRSVIFQCIDPTCEMLVCSSMRHLRALFNPGSHSSHKLTAAKRCCTIC